MEKYILNILKENSRVIIPEFGAFIIRQQNPPEIAFNSFLTFNDNILTEYLSHNTGISFLEASSKVSEYVEKLKVDLKLHNRLTFNEIGWIWLDESGEMQFTPSKGGERIQSETPRPQRNLETILKEAGINETAGTDNIPESPIIQSADQVPFILDDTIKEVDIDATKDDLLKKPADDLLAAEEISAEPFSLEETAKSETGADIAGETHQDQGTEILIEPKINLAETLQEFQKEQTVTEKETPTIGIRFKHEMPPEETVIAQEPVASGIPDTEESPAELKSEISVHDLPEKPLEEVWQEIEARSAHPHEPIKKVKKRSWITPVTIIGVLIIIAGAGYLFFPEQIIKILHSVRQSSVEIQPGVEIGDNTEISPSVSATPDEQESVEETTPILNETETSEQQESPVVINEPEAPAKKYYVVAGRFRSQQNAEKYTAELRLKGFNAEYFATDDNLYTVSFNSFSTRESAEAELSLIRKSVEPKAWILYY